MIFQSKLNNSKAVQDEFDPILYASRLQDLILEMSALALIDKSFGEDSKEFIAQLALELEEVKKFRKELIVDFFTDQEIRLIQKMEEFNNYKLIEFNHGRSFVYNPIV